MKAMVVSGSRNPEGQTARAVEALLAGVRDAGGEGRVAFLPQLRIERCRQCDANGWGLCRQAGRCIIEDDFAGLVDLLRAADVAVFATPVYFSDLSESLRAFLDRLRRCCRHAEDHLGMADKPAVGLCVAGGGGGGAPACTVSLEKVLRTCGYDILDLIPIRRQNLGCKGDTLRLTGQWLVKQPGPKD